MGEGEGQMLCGGWNAPLLWFIPPILCLRTICLLASSLLLIFSLLDFKFLPPSSLLYILLSHAAFGVKLKKCGEKK